MKLKAVFSLILFALMAGLPTLSAAPTNTTASAATTTNATAKADDIDWARHVVKAYEDYTRQQQQTYQALDQARQDSATAAATAKRSTEVVEARLREIEQSLSSQRQRDVENLQQSQRSTLVVVGTVAGIGLICMLLLSLLIFRSMNRRFETVLAPLANAGLRANPAYAALGGSETQLATLDPAEQSSARFLSTLERLEKRLAAMESDLAEPVTTTGANGNGMHDATVTSPEPVVLDERSQEIASLLGKGQTLLNLEKVEEALACFGAVLALDPKNAEALVKKGTVLERQGKVDEAIECYDEAIAADRTMTMAYLCKGGVFNRLERYHEALACYEEALRTKEHTHVAS